MRDLGVNRCYLCKDDLGENPGRLLTSRDSGNGLGGHMEAARCTLSTSAGLPVAQLERTPFPGS